MKKLVRTIAPVAAIAVMGACTSAPAASPAVEWSAQNGLTYADGSPAYMQTFKVYNLPDSAESLAFNMFARQMMPVVTADTIIELVPGYYRIASPRIAQAAAQGDTVTISILTRGRITAISYSPDGVHGVSAGGHPFDVDFSRFDLLSDSTALAAVPDAAEIYVRNAALAGAAAPGAYHVVPSFKSTVLTGGNSTVDMDNIAFSAPADLAGTEKYRITVADNVIAVEADSAQWVRLRHRLRHWLGTGAVELPNAQIADEPSLGYRGLMIDVARNFQPASEVHRVLDLMADYGLNVFHFHAVDDEAWRLEIQSLPELTAIGSRRGYTSAGSENGYLPQLFTGNGNPDSSEGTSNGYYTRAEIVDIIRHADSLGITVLPEIESPGHARAAIVAMRNRPEYRLDEAADTSVYTSAQAFHDNVMNPALPGPYRFMETVVDELIDVYNEAGVPLKAVHIGGDEVPRRAWAGSPAVQALKDSLGLADDKAVHAYFVSRVADMIASKGLGVSGWQEVALRHPEEYNRNLAPKTYSVNCWSTLPRQGQGGVVEDIYAAGFPTILSNVDHFYLDMCYSPNPYERGLSWGGYVDEFDALAGYPARLAPGVQPTGIQGQVWAETIRSTAGLETLLLPKMMGMAERAWNTDSTYTDAAFNAIAAAEMPKWAAAGYAFHVNQPGIIRQGNTLTVNSSYPESAIYVSFDGTTPAASGTALRSGDSLSIPEGATQIRAIQCVSGIASAPSVMLLAE